MSRRWRTPAEWVRTRRQCRRSQLAEPGTCGACGRYLEGGTRHAHYVLRWLCGFREPPWQRGRPALDIVLSGAPGPTCQFVEVERAGWSVNVGELVPRRDGTVALRLRRKDLPR